MKSPLKLNFLFFLIILLSNCKKDEEVAPTNTSAITSPIIKDSLIVNPSAYAPLTATYLHYTSVATKAEVVIAAKSSNQTAFKHHYQEINNSHSIPILGLYPAHDNQVTINFYAEDQSLVESKQLSIKTDSLPQGMPNIKIDVVNKNEMEPGMTLVSYWGIRNPQMPFIMDKTGEIRWYLDYRNHPELNSLSYDNGIERLQNGHYYFGDITTNAIYEVNLYGKVIKKWPLLGHTFHHNVQEKSNGNFLITTSADNSIHTNGLKTIEDHVIELDRNSGQTNRVWDLKNSLDENRNAWKKDLQNEPVDWFHGNAVTEADNHGIIVSGRTQGVVKLNKDNQVDWIIAPHKDWDTSRLGNDLTQFLLQPLDQSGQAITDTAVINGSSAHADFDWPWYQHAHLTLPNGHLMLFDNGDNRHYTGNEEYSRAVEYKIDETNMTIQQVWSYGKARGKESFGQYVSDVDFLENKNNVLFSPGFATSNDNGIGGRIIEIDYATKTVIFEAQITPVNGSFVSFHRAERLSLYP